MKKSRQIAFALALYFTTALCLAQVPQAEAPLPPLRIDERGELLLEGDEFSYRPWNSADHPGKVHVIQMINGTMSDSKLFEPFTDRLQEELESGSYHVTTVINLDAALWGTSGFVISELKKNKRKYPLATMVVDDEGIGARQWQLGDNGAGLFVVDRAGVVRFLALDALGEDELRSAVELVRSEIARGS